MPVKHTTIIYLTYSQIMDLYNQSTVYEFDKDDELILKIVPVSDK